MSTPKRVKVTGSLYTGQVPDGAIYVGRKAPGLAGSPYANPFALQRKFTRMSPLRPYLDAAITGVTALSAEDLTSRAYYVVAPETAEVATAAYRPWLASQPGLIAEARRRLAGEDLACWCGLPSTGQLDHCHGAWLLLVANYLAPCTQPLTTLHLLNPASSPHMVGMAAAVGEAQCGLPLFVKDTWVPVVKRDSDTICDPCMHDPEPEAGNRGDPSVNESTPAIEELW